MKIRLLSTVRYMTTNTQIHLQIFRETARKEHSTIDPLETHTTDIKMYS